jgi:hypothetical protein
MTEVPPILQEFAETDRANRRFDCAPSDPKMTHNIHTVALYAAQNASSGTLRQSLAIVG